MSRPDWQGNSALHLVARADSNLAAALLLLRAGANAAQANGEGESALDMAERAGAAAMAEQLRFAVAARGSPRTVDRARELMRLAILARDGDAAALDAALARAGGESLDLAQPLDEEVGDTLLHAAAAGGHVPVLRALLARGALVHIRNALGCTALHAAAMHGHTEAIEFLLERGADPRESDKEGYCPMHYAAGEGHSAALEALTARGRCDPTLKTFVGLTVLHIAVAEGRGALAARLLAALPSLAAIPDADGALPVEYARAARVRDDALVRVLEAAHSGSRVLVQAAAPPARVAGSIFAGDPPATP